MARNEFSTHPHFKGSYTYQVGGINENDYRALEHPLHQKIYFAGEAYNRWEFGFTHTAYTNGWDAAKNLTGCMKDSDKCLPDAPDYIVRDCKTSSAAQRLVLVGKLVLLLIIAFVMNYSL